MSSADGWRRAAGLVAAGLLAAKLSAPAAAQDGDGRRRAVEQKLQFVGRLVSDSPATEAIVAGENAEAKELLATTNDHYRRAEALLAQGKVDEAERTINKAILAIVRARQLISHETAQAQLHARYRELLQSTETLLASYRRHVQSLDSAAAPEVERIQALVDEAKAMHERNDTRGALGRLGEAHKGLLEELNRLLGSATLDYTPKFDSLAEEFGFELERHRSFAELVPLAIKELNPTRDARTLIDRYVERSKYLHQTAMTLAEQKEYPGALTALRQATLELQRALTAAGVVIPPQ